MKFAIGRFEVWFYPTDWWTLGYMNGRLEVSLDIGPITLVWRKK